MFVAQLNNQFISLMDFSKDQMMSLKRQSFICPACKEQLVLKIGKVKLPHFAHKNNSQCSAYFSEKESVKHLNGKNQLYQFLKAFSHHVQLEPFLNELKQRPDILIECDGINYAIEFQCSVISDEILHRRTSNYKLHHFQPVWILNTPTTYEKAENGITKIRLSHFQQQFIQYDLNQAYLLTYEPNRQCFIYFSNLMHISGNTFLTKAQILPISHQKFPFLKPRIFTFQHFKQYYLLFKVAQQNYLKTKLFVSRKGVNDPLLRSVYELRLNQFNLPNYLGVPIKESEHISLHNVEWQTALFYFAKIKKINIHELTDFDLGSFLKWLQLSGEVKQRKVLKNYLKYLELLAVESTVQNIQEEKNIEKLYTHLVAISLEN